MKKIGRLRRHKRITKKLKGTSMRPRLVVFRSKKNIYAQVIDDSMSKVIAGCSTLSKEFKSKALKASGKEAAKEIGRSIAQKSLDLGIKSVSFDRGGYLYHGRVESLAQGAKEGGLKF
ncbi:MAG: 50S ribosomal protein L18 [Candidatus Omnitrophica bacterium]|nr:50S ribosomal protein L18 [Candidatus Omnitrophota bacterium]MDD5429146.1 50S ribosomal protein L18 [Candidatus Omnitrophota bacterium]